MKKLILAVGCSCLLSVPAYSESIPQPRAKEMTAGKVSCQNGICVHFGKDNYAPYVEVRVESETVRVYKTGRTYRRMTKLAYKHRTGANFSSAEYDDLIWDCILYKDSINR